MSNHRRQKFPLVYPWYCNGCEAIAAASAPNGGSSKKSPHKRPQDRESTINVAQKRRLNGGLDKPDNRARPSPVLFVSSGASSRASPLPADNPERLVAPSLENNLPDQVGPLPAEKHELIGAPPLDNDLPEQAGPFSDRESSGTCLIIYVNNKSTQRIVRLGKVKNVGDLYERCATKLGPISRPFVLTYQPLGLDQERLSLKVIDDDDFNEFVGYVKRHWKNPNKQEVLIYIRIKK
jgi:hypothetical protein